MNGLNDSGILANTFLLRGLHGLNSSEEEVWSIMEELGPLALNE